MKSVSELVNKYLEKAISYRRHIHENPELSMQEKETSEYVASVLREIGLEPKTNVGGYGVTAIIEGKATSSKCVALRADMDALSIKEQTGLAFSSKHDGVAHACGHDMHTAMLLGAAHVLNEMRNDFSGIIKLVFQPAEESVLSGGAPDMIRDGVLENPKVDAIIGQHVWPMFETGTAAVRDGAMMASSDRFFITIKGKASHGSAPDEGIDAIVIAANVITALQSIVARNVSPLDSAVVTIGTIKGGDRYNIIPNEVFMEGTCRNLNPEVRNSMPARIEGIVKGISQSMGGDYAFEYKRGYSPTVNDPKMFSIVHSVMEETIGKENTFIPKNSGMGGEDFSFYCEKIPSVFYWLGCRNKSVPFSESPVLHNGSFAPEEEAMPIGMNIMVKSALKFLEN